MSIHYLKNPKGQVTSVRAVASKCQGKQIRATFSLRTFGSLEKAITAAQRWISAKVRDIERDRHAIIAIPDAMRPEIIEALELLEPYGIRIVDAIREWIAHKQVTSREAWTFGQAVGFFLQSRRDKHARPEYLRSIEDTLSLVARTFGDKILDDITTEELEAFLRARGKTVNGSRQPISGVTWRNYRRDIGMVFRFAIDREHAGKNPAHKISEPESQDKPVIIFSTKALKSALLHADPDVKGIMAIMAFSGIRPYEALQLPPENIHMERRFIEIKGRHSKSRTRRLVTIPYNLAKWLEAYPVRAQFKNYWILRRLLEQAAEKAGLAMSQDVLRHSFGSHHLALHRSASLTAHEMGNSERMVYQHYREVVTQEEAREYFDVVPLEQVPSTVDAP